MKQKLALGIKKYTNQYEKKKHEVLECPKIYLN